MGLKNILLCTLLFFVGCLAGKKALKWKDGRDRPLKVPTLERELAHADDSKERDVYLFLHTQNHAQAICRCLSTLAMQKYENLHIYLLDENSTDGTWEKANDYLSKHRVAVDETLQGSREELCTFVDSVLAQAEENALMVTLEGKDWLPHSRVVKLLNHKMVQQKCRLLLGQYSTYPDYTLGIDKRWIKLKVEKQKWPKSEAFPSIFKAFDVALFKKINQNDPFVLNQEEAFHKLYQMAREKTFFSKSVYYVENRLEPGKKLLFSEGE